jgi:hypothetical protein
MNDLYLLHPTICLIFRRIGIYYVPPSVLSSEGLVFITSHHLSYLQKDWYLLHPTKSGDVINTNPSEDKTDGGME